MLRLLSGQAIGSATMSANRRRFLLRTIYAACLPGATYNHVAILISHSLFWDYGGVPAASAAFWTAPTFIDPVAILLLFLLPNFGVIATAAIIIVDVTHNLWITMRYFPPFLHGIADSPAMMEQILFMVLVIFSARFAWKPESRRQFG